MSWRATLVLTVTLSGIAVTGCRPVRAFAASHRSTSQFLSSADPRVSYEPGAEMMARELDDAMPGAVAAVEQRMFGRFELPVRVYACATIDSLTSYGADSRAGGFTTNHRIFISPKPENTPERVPRVLAHELSHLHLGQKRGMASFSALPVWFVEGLAVDVSGGAGAEGVSEGQARESIAAGRSFVPEPDGSLWHRKGAAAYGLTEHMFYRQAGLFVSFMRAIDGAKSAAMSAAMFAAMIAAIENGASLGDAFRDSYGMPVDAAWRRFLAQTPPAGAKAQSN